MLPSLSFGVFWASASVVKSAVPRTTAPSKEVGNRNLFIVFPLQSIRIGLSRLDSDRLTELEDEDHAVPGLAAMGRLLDGFHDPFGQIVVHRDLDLDLRQEVLRALGAAVDFRVPLLAAEAFDFAHLRFASALTRDSPDDHLR